MLYLLPHAVERAADRAPEHHATRCNGEHLTYAALAEQSDRLARVLREEGVRRGDRVGLFLGKGLTSAIGIYGIMKAGAAYVPLDPVAPVARAAFILRDCGIRHLVSEPARGETLRRLTADGVALDCIIGVAQADGGARTVSWDEVGSAPAEWMGPQAMEQDLAYILYTSGSTGTPKGVMHTHRSALSWAQITALTYGFRADDRFSNHAPLHFDLSTLDYFSAAVAGATTVIVPDAHARLPASYSRLIEEERLTVLYAVPFALIQLLLRGALEQRDFSSVRWVLFGGEPFPTKHLRALMRQLPHARFCNVYGPTETNGCTHYIVPKLRDGCNDPIPIGVPYGNVEALVVDDQDRPVERGAAGQLLIRSPTLMRGYWARPDLNQRAFYRRPAFGAFEDIFHRTGDMVRERPDGAFEFLGRADRQIKARGYRVELDEVEAVLLTHDDVEAAAVFAVADAEGSQHIEAAVIARPGTAPAPAALGRHAAAQLPSYAVPERIDVVAEFPRTSTGKIDRLRLQETATAPRQPLAPT